MASAISTSTWVPSFMSAKDFVVPMGTMVLLHVLCALGTR
jgi:hypothetical protein